MKPKLNLKNFVFLCFIFLGTTSIAQTTHIVTLKVNTELITQRLTNRHANFGQPRGISNKNFTIYAYKGDIIEWEAVDSSGKGRAVTIEEINYESGTELFGNKKIKRKGREKKIKRKIKKGKRDQSEKYSIVFSFVKDGETKTIKIDPKIVIKK
ncbi:MAG: hypothetical protein CMB99_02475 [Flavobacteriaceae bacterium]|nr:hypothetical protein [Flavobacteriaceae bacterium]|tara:strand:- start:61337 stop:61798 length:462 start_codon:yes stop_codon:yes gene_type:complete